MSETEFQMEFNDSLEEAYFERFGPSIVQIKDIVGYGEEFENRAARIMISPEGVWFECVNLPMEFAGSTGAEIDREYLLDKESATAADKLYDGRQSAIDNSVGKVSMFVLYSPEGIVDPSQMYSYRADGGNAGVTQEWGTYQMGVQPYAFKYAISGGSSRKKGAFNNGFIFYLSRIGDVNILVKAYTGGGNVIDLAPPEMGIIQ